MDLVDDNSYLGGTHEQLTAENKKKEDVFLMSMWDIEKEFRWIVFPAICLFACLSTFCSFSCLFVVCICMCMHCV